MNESRRRLLIYLGIIVAGALLIAIGPFVLDRYTVNILVRSFLYAIAVLTVDLLWGITGILTFGQSAFFAIGAYAAGLVFTHLGFSPTMAGLALIGGVAASMAVAWLVGWISFWHRATALYVAVVTLALPIVVVQLLYSGGKFTGSSSGLVGFETFNLSVTAWFWIAGWLMIAFTAIALCFVRSNFGEILTAIRENENRCQFLGINTTAIKIGLLMVAALIAAVAGYAYAGFTVVVAPELAGFVFGTELVIYTALGGRGTVLGPVLGAVAIDLTSAYLSGSLPYVWKLIVGVIFVTVIVLLPQGIAPVLTSAFRKVGGRLRIAARSARQQPASITLTPVAHEVPQAGASGSALPLKIENLSRHYGALHVLSDINLEARSSEILSIVGPNGAGKTTLMRCISDGFERSGGQVWVNGVEIGRNSPQKLVGLGVGRSFQNTSLFESLSVGECLRLARFRLEGASVVSRRQDLALPQSVLKILEATGLDHQLQTRVRDLSHGLKRALELSMVLATEPAVLLLDEPTAGLTKPERAMIGEILTDLARTDGLCILLIEHDLDFVREISARIVVLHQGRVLMDGSVAEVISSDLVASVYAGKQLHQVAEAAK